MSDKWISMEEQIPKQYGIYRVKNKLWTAIAKWNDFTNEWSEIRDIKGACIYSPISHYIPIFTLSDLEDK